MKYEIKTGVYGRGSLKAGEWSKYEIRGKFKIRKNSRKENQTMMEMIKKKIMTDVGVEAEIWKVGYISLDRVNKYGSITICLYVSETASKYIYSIVEPILSPEVFDTYFENGGDVIENAELFMIDNCDLFKEEQQEE